MKSRLLLPFACLTLLGLLVAVYNPVLCHDRQFAGGNAAYFDYPLFLRVQQEWNAGRWPLWDPGQNGGSPLLGNPMAAVLYPGKLLHAILPFHWAIRLQVIGHTLVAFLGLLVLSRSLGTGWVGSILGGLGYAFGAPILGQYTNTNLMIGAAWVPWGLHAVDRTLRRDARGGMAELAVILALQVLAGDPEAAYLTVCTGAAFAAILALRQRTRLGWRLSWLAIPGAILLWVAAAWVLFRFRWALPGSRTTSWIVLAFWGATGLVLVWSWRRRAESRLVSMLARLLAASGLALALAAVQVLPVLEFSGRSWRAGGLSAQEMYRYSLEPIRMAELVWPHVFGTSSAGNRSWLQAIPPAGSHQVWIESLYMGGSTLGLALVGWKGKRGSPWRALLAAIVLGGLLLSFGKYASPLWWKERGADVPSRDSQAPFPASPDSEDWGGEGFGSPYGLLATLLPGFSTFRFPSKVVVFAAAGLAALAGMGWDQVMEAELDARRLRQVGLLGMAVSLAGLMLSLLGASRAVSWLTGRMPLDVMLGPADPAGAWRETQRSLTQGAIVFGSMVVLARLARARPRTAGSLALVFLAVDLAAANTRLIVTVPRAAVDSPSEVSSLIESAERADPSAGPFRVHRMPGAWFPGHFATTSSPTRRGELVQWARSTLFPLYGLPLKIEYCATSGSLELDDHIAFFEATEMPAPSAMARVLNVSPGQPVVYYPRRSFDLWGTRYFILPAWPNWSTRERGFASFLQETELIYPSAFVLHTTQPDAGREPWPLRQDWQLRRNRAAYPRAWLVHYARIRPPAGDPETRASLMRTLLFMNDAIWQGKDRTVLDLRQVALIETDDKAALQRFLSPKEVGPAESVTVLKHEAQRVELRAMLTRPGIVVLADTYYPGWSLTIDGKPAPIYRANRLMRGAAVEAGEHTLIYTYQPGSFQLGAVISAGGGMVLCALLFWPRRGVRMPPLPVVDSADERTSQVR